MADAMRTDGGLIVEVRERVAYATLDRPERLNARRWPVATGVLVDRAIHPALRGHRGGDAGRAGRALPAPGE